MSIDGLDLTKRCHSIVYDYTRYLQGGGTSELLALASPTLCRREIMQAT
jgi:hypothetical protein